MKYQDIVNYILLNPDKVTVTPLDSHKSLVTHIANTIALSPDFTLTDEADFGLATVQVTHPELSLAKRSAFLDAEIVLEYEATSILMDGITEQAITYVGNEPIYLTNSEETQGLVNAE